jgi:hypothetical protein
MKHGLHFYTCYLSLTLNNALTSLGNNGCLGTLNLKLQKLKDKVSKKTYPILKNKK